MVAMTQYEEQAPPRALVSNQIRVDPDVYTRARDSARRQQISLNQWIVQAIEAQLAREARRSGR